MSFVVVLPFEPVIATTDTFERFRLNEARSPNAFVVSPTATQTTFFFCCFVNAGRLSVLFLFMIMPRTPCSITSPAKLWPS